MKRVWFKVAMIIAGVLTNCAAQPVFNNGDRVQLESLGDIAGLRWLNGRPHDGTVDLAPTFGRPYIGTTWQVETLGGDLFRLQTRSDVAGSHWLSCRSTEPAVVLLPTSAGASGFQTQWHIVPISGDSIGLRCADSGSLWLNARTRKGQVELFPSTSSADTGNRWLAHLVLPADVLTQRYNSFRTGINPAETILTPALIKSGRFGKLFTRTVEGQIYGQPLYAGDLSLPGKGQHNVVFISTAANLVYAFDADDPAQDKPLWISERLGTPVPRSDIVPDKLIDPVFGIISTPVIDLATKTLYVVAKSKTVVSVGASGDLAAGDTITLQCLSNKPGSQWLNGLTADGQVSLANAFGGDANSGTWWQVAIPTGPDALSLMNLGWTRTATVWLDGRTADGSIGLAPSTAPPFTGTSWRAHLVATGQFTLENLGTRPGPKFLQGVTAKATVDLAAAPTYTGTRWRIQKHVYHNVLFALDLLTGKVKRKVEIEGEASGTRFSSKLQLNRPGLLFADGRVYVAFGSHADRTPFNGWIFAYNAADLKLQGVFVTASNGSGAGIWQSGAGLAADESGNVYAMTGNSFSAAGKTDFPNSFIKLHTDQASRKVELTGAFPSASGQSFDPNVCDLDLGSSGPVYLSGTALVIGAGKEGTLYSLDTSQMKEVESFNVSKNQYDPTPPKCGRWFDVETWPHVHASPVVLSVDQHSMHMYVWPEQDFLKGFLMKDGLFEKTPFATSVDKSPDMSMPGGMLAISAHGGDIGTAIVWATRPSDCPPNATTNEDQRPCNAQFNTVPGVLKAFDAMTLEQLWDSSAVKDQLGSFAKFNPPTIAHGRVYVATFGNNLAVYGVRPGI